MHILLELVDSLERHIGYNTVREFEVNYPLSKSADIKKKYLWANTICSYLEEHFNTDTIICIRK